MVTDETLELSEAAKILGVHSSTLRRWADAGVVPHMRTLSGRRRFSRSAIEQAREVMGHPAAQVKDEAFEQQTLSLARQHRGALPAQHAVWSARFNEDQRLMLRYSGQRLLGLMLQFISRGRSGDTFLEEGRRMAGDYGRICYQAGLSVAQTVEAFLYFRRSIIEAVQETTRLGGPNDQEGNRIFLRTMDFFDALLVSTIESYRLIKQSE